MMAGYSLYDATIPTAINALGALDAVLVKAEAAPNAASLPSARICADMQPLTFQVMVATGLAIRMLHRIMGKQPPELPEEPKSFAEMRSQVAEAQKKLKEADAALINQRMYELVPLGLGPDVNIELPGVDYVNRYGLPNIFFHVTTAYDIVRKEGVPLGKPDYLTPFLGRFAPEQK